MSKIHKLIGAIMLLLMLSASIYAQCWSISANNGSSISSDVRPSGNKEYEAILAQMEPALQKGMGVTSKIFLTETQRVYANPVNGNVYFGKKFFDYLDRKYQQDIKQIGVNPIPVGLKLIIAHEYAHGFQFRMFKKKKLPLADPTPVDELQADVLASYFLGSSLDTQFSDLPMQDKVKRVMDESGGAIFVVSQLGDQFFNDANHHGDPITRSQCMQFGFSAGWVHQFGVPEVAMTSKEDEVFEWSRKFAAEAYKRQHNGVLF